MKWLKNFLMSIIGLGEPEHIATVSQDFLNQIEKDKQIPPKEEEYKMYAYGFGEDKHNSAIYILSNNYVPNESTKFAKYNEGFIFKSTDNVLTNSLTEFVDFEPLYFIGKNDKNEFAFARLFNLSTRDSVKQAIDVELNQLKQTISKLTKTLEKKN